MSSNGKTLPEKIYAWCPDTGTVEKLCEMVNRVIQEGYKVYGDDYDYIYDKLFRSDDNQFGIAKNVKEQFFAMRDKVYDYPETDVFNFEACDYRGGVAYISDYDGNECLYESTIDTFEAEVNNNG